jgi:uncharacterized membrane protein
LKDLVIFPVISLVRGVAALRFTVFNDTVKENFVLRLGLGVGLVISIILNLVLVLNLYLKALSLALDFKLNFILDFYVIGFIFRLCLASEFDFFGFFGYSIIVILLVSTSDTV